MRVVPVALCVTVLLTLASPADAQGKYARRQRNRGEVTDTAAKLDRYAFINDDAPKPRELVLVVDTWTARLRSNPRLLPLVIALSFEGAGPPLPVRPDRLELWWESAAAPVRALSFPELTCRDETKPCRGTTGPSPVYQDERAFSRRSPIPFDPPGITRTGLRFYTHVALSDFVNDDIRLQAGRWVATMAYFPVPEGFDASRELLELRYVPIDGEPPAVSCRFRIQERPALQQDAMRRAKKDLRREEERR